MNYSTAVFLINKSARAVKVSYEPDPARPDEAIPGKTYIFKTLDPTIAVRDFVIIPTDTRWQMTIGRVEEVDVEVDFDAPIQLKWIIGRVDLASHNTVLAQEAQAITSIRSAEIRRKRDELARDLFADNDALRALPIATNITPGIAPPHVTDEPVEAPPYTPPLRSSDDISF